MKSFSDGFIEIFKIPVREISEKEPVEIATHENGRKYILASNEGGYSGVIIDLKDILDYLGVQCGHR